MLVFVTAGVKQPVLDSMERADPDKAYALCVKGEVTDLKGAAESLVLVPPEEQRWQKVGFPSDRAAFQRSRAVAERPARGCNRDSLYFPFIPNICLHISAFDMYIYLVSV